MLGDIEVVSDLADGSECIRRLVQMPTSLQFGEAQSAFAPPFTGR